MILRKSSSKKVPPFYRPAWVEISHPNLQHNYLTISRLVSGLPVLCVVKANAYGHGLNAVSRTLSRFRPPLFGVTSLEEALCLKDEKARVPALILGNIYPFTNLAPAIKIRTRITVASMESAVQCDRAGIKAGKKVYVHAKIDTGMNRIGVRAQRGLEFIEQILKMRSLELEGIYTHFSGSAEDPAFTKKQIHLFTDLIHRLNQKGIHIPYIHCANSAALMKYPESRFTAVRPGISLYGFNPLKDQSGVQLKPALAWKSRIVFLKEVPPHTPVSYAGTFKTKRRSKIATAAFGYADGFRRILSNKASVLVRGKRCPVLGRVTMDMTMVDVTEIPGVSVGDEVVLIGQQEDQVISVQEFADWCQTSPYEVFCGISTRVPRVNVYR